MLLCVVLATELSHFHQDPVMGWPDRSCRCRDVWRAL